MPRATHTARLLSVAGLALLLSSTSASAQDPPLPDLSGTWAQLQVTSSVARVPVIGEMHSQTTSILLYHATQSDNTVSARQEICDIKMSSESKRVRTIIPSSFRKAASGTKRTAKLVWINGRLQFVQEPATVVLGAKLDNSKKDTLPEEDDDRRVYDQDGDGNPGVTIQIRGLLDAELFLVQRGWNKLIGTVTKDGIDGVMRWNSEQNVIGSTSVFVRSSPPTKPHGGAKQNYFKMRRVDADMTCAELRRTYKSLFN